MKWLANAPSNIALIKYMGKKDYVLNTPANPSLSYTLNKFLSTVELESFEGSNDRWESLPDHPIQLTERNEIRFLMHLDYLKKQFNYKGHFIVRSSNNFPAYCGLASSASSFAALTKCAIQALSELTQKPIPSIEEQARFSRVGSGSSCRSFFSPWAIWHDEIAESIDLPCKHLEHCVILINREKKRISSSNAHRSIISSSYFKERPKRATQRLEKLILALKQQEWQDAYELTWQEFLDMHQLFSTSEPPFNYMSKETDTVLNYLRASWKKRQDGPLVTMDAGPNIHLLFRPDQTQYLTLLKNEITQGFGYECL